MDRGKRQVRHETLADDARLASLLRRARAGDADAYRTFLTELSGRLRRQIRARSGPLDDADVEDLVQEILISIHVSRATWDAAKPVLPWIAAIARYRIADHHRRLYRTAALSRAIARLAETFSTPGTNSTSEDVLNDMSMTRALKDLSKTERRAFTLVRLRGLSLNEAARFSGSTVAAVKVAVHRAARKLQALAGEGRL